MSLQSTLIQLPRRSRSCNGCLKQLACGSECFTILHQGTSQEDSPEGFLRRDYCSACWESEREKNTHMNSPYWKSAIHDKKSVSDQTLTRDALALDLLRSNAPPTKLPNEPDSLTEDELFCLALYLMRKRQLLQRGEILQNNLPCLLLEVAGTDELLAIKKMTLANLDLPALQKSLANRLGAASHAA